MMPSLGDEKTATIGVKLTVFVPLIDPWEVAPFNGSRKMVEGVDA
jgi:hypothetical protein